MGGDLGDEEEVEGAVESVGEDGEHFDVRMGVCLTV